MLTIDAITMTVFRLPLHGRLQWGRHSMLDEVRHVLVRVCLSDGAEGAAEAPPRPTIYGETAATITSIIRDELAPRLVGQPAEDLGALNQIKHNHTARAAIDTAVQDAIAQSRGISLLDRLQELDGSDVRPASEVRVSYILGIGDDETVLAEAQRVFDQGVRVLKVKVGRDWQADVRRLRTLRAMFGAPLTLYVDANECFGVEEAAVRLDALRELGVLYCEEPLPVEQIRARAALRAGAHLPLIADDSAFTLRDLRRELSMETFDILNIKPARTGYTESAQMLAAARTAGKGVMVGSQAGSALGSARAGLLAALPGVAHPSELSFFLKLRADIVPRPPVIRDGFVRVADLLAVRVDEDLLRDAAVGD